MNSLDDILMIIQLIGIIGLSLATYIILKSLKSIIGEPQ